MKKLLEEYLDNIEMNEKNIKRKNIASILTIITEFIKIILTFIFIEKFSFLNTTIIFSFSTIVSLLALYILYNDDYSTLKKYNWLDLSAVLFFVSNIYSGILIELILYKAQKNLFSNITFKKLKLKKLTNKLFYEKKVYIYVFLSILICYEKLQINGIIFCILTFIGILPFFIKDIKQGIKEFKKNKKGYIIYTLKVYFITSILGSLLFMLMFFIIGEDSTNQQLLEQEPLLWSLFTSIIYAPIVEELLFRGCLRKLMKNDLIFILVSGISFGIWHVIGFEQSVMQYLYVIPYSVMGVGLSFVYAKTNNLSTNIGMHAFHNTFASIASLI